MKRNTLLFCFLLFTVIASAQSNAGKTNNTDSNTDYKKRVLENTEIDLLSSFYTQNGENAAVTGGIGSEKLNDFATNITVSIPLNADDVLTIDGTISAYTSASSSNLNPFTGASTSTTSGRLVVSGASSSGGGRPGRRPTTTENTTSGSNVGSPWVASSGASRSDVWTNGIISYNHSSNDRNTTYGGNLSVSNEYDYRSFGAGLSLSHQFNDKNSELGLKGNLYLDKWLPQYPTELKTYIVNQGNLNVDYFSGVDILNESGTAINKAGINSWSPLHNYLVTTDNRNTYSVSLSFSQVLGKNSQLSIFSDLILQKGWLSNPMQRVYFADRDNYYVGTASSIPNYESPLNRNVFQLADDIERLPGSRLKIPVGIRYHQYVNEHLVVRTYYRYYSDDWGITAHTTNIELPIKLGDHFTVYPNYRYYIQTAAKYFAPYEQHLSTEEFYTSDYDLSAFDAQQYGLGMKYTDVFTKGHLGKLGLKSLSLDYGLYIRSTGLKANIISIGAKFVVDK